MCNQVLTDNVVDIWNGDPARAYEPRDRGHIDALRSDCHIRVGRRPCVVCSCIVFAHASGTVDRR